MRVGLLGQLQVVDADERDVTVPAGKQRALLALLALHAGRVVPAEQVIDALWGEAPPARVRNGLQALASKLRSALAAPDVLVMRGGGYVLDVPPDAVDAGRYEHLVAEGRAVAADDPERAVALFAEADALWRGEPLAEFAYEEFAQPAISRLSELRLSVLEERLELELALGRLDGGIVELEALVRAHPLRERLRALLMVALYRAGRQADALQELQDARRILGEELGLDPGPELRRLEAAILAQDPSLDGPGATVAGAPARGRRSPGIPEALTPIVGRDGELRELGGVLADHRLVSLVGPGGVGTTRLAVEAARALAATLPGGGCLVELAPVGDPAGVRGAVASALDAPDESGLVELVGDLELVIVLDNCEHVIQAAAELADDLLRACPNVRLLATSREALRVGGELVWPVPPLAPDDAVELFASRAQAQGVGLELSEEIRRAIVDVCVRLDGLPLAIELAAARARALPVNQIASRLNDRFRLLTGGSRTALPRQQTLRAVVDWSYDLLFDQEQRVFERLSVFPGGCDLAAAEAVCADDDLAAADVADVIQALVDKSLVGTRRSRDTVRFVQLQTLAQYGHEKLAERGDARRVRQAMAEHFARRCAESKVAFTGPEQGRWLSAINEEHDNLRAALEWAVDADDAETASLIAGGSAWAHWLAGTAVEGRRWIDAAFAAAGERSDETLALALTGRALLGLLLGSPAGIDDDLEAALKIFRDAGDMAGLAFAYSFYAELPRLQGDADEARRRRTEALDLYLGLPDDPFVVAVRAYSRGILALLDGDLEAAEARYREAEDGFLRTNRPFMRTMCLGVIADFDERAGRYAAAVRALDEAIRLAEALGMRGFIGSLYSRLAWALLEDGDDARAEAEIQRALDAGRRLQSPQIMFLALAGAALVHHRHGDDVDAAAAATEVLRIHHTGGTSRFRNRIDPDFEILSVSAACCTMLAVIALDNGDAERGARLLGHAAGLRERCGATTPAFQVDDADRARAAALATMGEGPFAAAFAAGRDADLGDLVAFAP
jgi:predicted ATPase/DNA-binding SARP family transcriptional activator